MSKNIARDKRVKHVSITFSNKHMLAEVKIWLDSVQRKDSCNIFINIESKKCKFK